MRVAYVSADPGVPVFGRKGCSIHVQEVLRALCRRGAEVELLAASFGGACPQDLDTVRARKIPLPPRVGVEQSELDALAANEDVRQQLQRISGLDFIYERWALWSFAAMEFARSAGIPGVLEVNAPLIEEQARYRSLHDRPGADLAARRALAAASVIVAVSEEVASYLSTFPETHGRVHVVPNGVDPQRFIGASRAGALDPARELTIGFVGTLKPWHGVTTLVEAFGMHRSRFPGARLLIVGDGPERRSIEQLIGALQLDSFTQFTGAVSPSDVPRLLSQMDVAIAPYPLLADFYFSPLKVYEYMAAGLPVVASRIGQIMKVISDGVNGILYEPGDAFALASALDRLRLEPELRVRLGQSARKSVLQRHTWSSAVERIVRLATQAEPVTGVGVA